MKKKIFINMCFIALLGVILSSFLFFLVVYNYQKNLTFENLDNQSIIVKDSLKFQNYNNDYLQSLKSILPDTRITLIKPDGVVIFDSTADVSTMENHLTRPEVKDAISKGAGQSMRFSTTLSQDTYYYAVLLENNYILRLSKDAHSVFKIFFDTFPLILFSIVIAFILCMIISRKLTKAVLKPLEDISNNVDDILKLDSYDEFSPFLNKIINQSNQIKEQNLTLKSGKDTLNTISANMKEGLILIDEKKNILSVNKSAITFLNAKEKDYTSLNLLSLCRIPQLISQVDNVLLGESHNFEINIDDNYYNVFLNPFFSEDKQSGAIILLLDITQKKKTEKMKHDFSANVSHELRTPLTTISGFAEIIKNDMISEKEDIKKFGTLIHDEAHRLITLVDDIMQLAQIEDNPDVKFENINIFDTCKNITVLLSSQIQQKEIDINYIINSQDNTVYANNRMIEEMIYNLFENAIKYNKQGGKIQIIIEKNDNKMNFSICDSGIGIPKEHQARIFERFYRVDKSRSKATGGTGLGLSIVKHIVEYNKGTITLESTFGTGTKISITI